MRLGLPTKSIAMVSTEKWPVGQGITNQKNLESFMYIINICFLLPMQAILSIMNTCYIFFNL